MTDEAARGRLTRGAKAALLDTMRKVRVGEKPSVVASVPRAGRHDVSFASLPAYRQLSTQRTLADVMDVSFPFYRTHDVRAGAQSVIGGSAVMPMKRERE